MVRLMGFILILLFVIYLGISYARYCSVSQLARQYGDIIKKAPLKRCYVENGLLCIKPSPDSVCDTMSFRVGSESVYVYMGNDTKQVYWESDKIYLEKLIIDKTREIMFKGDSFEDNGDRYDGDGGLMGGLC